MDVFTSDFSRYNLPLKKLQGKNNEYTGNTSMQQAGSILMKKNIMIFMNLKEERTGKYKEKQRRKHFDTACIMQHGRCL